MTSNEITIFEDLSTGEAFEYEGKVYFKATGQGGGEDCGFCMEDSNVRFTFPKEVRRLHFSNYDVNEEVENEYHKSMSSSRKRRDD